MSTGPANSVCSSKTSPKWCVELRIWSTFSQSGFQTEFRKPDYIEWTKCTKCWTWTNFKVWYINSSYLSMTKLEFAAAVDVRAAGKKFVSCRKQKKWREMRHSKVKVRKSRFGQNELLIFSDSWDVSARDGGPKWSFGAFYAGKNGPRTWYLRGSS